MPDFSNDEIVGQARRLMQRENMPEALRIEGAAPVALEEAARRHLVARDGALEAGDVVLFRLMRHRPARHCGVMVRADRFVHAQEHVGVVEVALGESWTRRVAGVCGFP